MQSLKACYIGGSKIYVAQAKTNKAQKFRFPGKTSSSHGSLDSNVEMVTTTKVSNTNIRNSISHVLNTSDKNPRSTVNLTLPIDKTFQEEVDRSVLLHSINSESVETINSVVTGLGYRDTIIRGISSHKFIAFFPLEENLENTDLDFLSIGFKEVRKLNHED